MVNIEWGKHSETHHQKQCNCWGVQVFEFKEGICYPSPDQGGIQISICWNPRMNQQGFHMTKDEPPKWFNTWPFSSPILDPWRSRSQPLSSPKTTTWKFRRRCDVHFHQLGFPIKPAKNQLPIFSWMHPKKVRMALPGLLFIFSCGRFTHGRTSHFSFVLSEFPHYSWKTQRHLVTCGDFFFVQRIGHVVCPYQMEISMNQQEGSPK